MVQHPIAAIQLCGALLTAAYLCYTLLLQPRDLVWYMKASSIAFFKLITGISFYRLVFHPLAKYPGPLIAALTDWYVVYWIAEGGRHLELHKQHKKHGKHIRYGPNRLSLTTPAASRDLHDVKANNLKSDAYGGAKHLFGTEMSTTIIDHKAHAFRRRVNVAALTPTIVKGFADLVSPHVDYLLKVIGEGSKPAADAHKAANDDSMGWSPGRDMSHYIAYCVADMMGTITFSRSLNTQRDPTHRNFIKDSPLGVAGIHILGHMQSLMFCNLHKIIFQKLSEGIDQLTSTSRANALWRIEERHLDRDIWSSLLDAKDPTTKAKFTKEQLISEAGMFIIAGTDSTVTVSCATLFYVLRHPRILDRLTREIRTAFPLPANAAGKLTSEVECPIKFASTELQNINYLYACIDEAMRLSPPHTSILPREIGPGGQIVDGEFFPQGVNLGINMYTLHHSDECFPNALTYAPERWLPGEKGSSEARVSDSSAFTPFGVGRYSCIGKHLAYQDISYILARQIWLYDIRLDPNSSMGGGLGDEPEGRGCEGEFQLYDRYVSEQHGPVVQFRYRKDI